MCLVGDFVKLSLLELECYILSHSYTQYIGGKLLSPSKDLSSVETTGIYNNMGNFFDFCLALWYFWIQDLWLMHGWIGNIKYSLKWHKDLLFEISTSKIIHFYVNVITFVTWRNFLITILNILMLRWLVLNIKESCFC